MNRRFTPLHFCGVLINGTAALIIIYVVLRAVLGLSDEVLGPYMIMSLAALAGYAFASFNVELWPEARRSAKLAIANGLFYAGLAELLCARLYALAGYHTPALHGALGGLGLIGASLVIVWKAENTAVRQPCSS